jgi:hypothetical protein
MMASLMAAPPGFGAEAVMHTITLSWYSSPSPNVVGYRVHVGTQSGLYPIQLDAGNQTMMEVPHLIDGTTYYFMVTAYLADGTESFPSEEIHYLPNPTTLLNISARGEVQIGDKVMIAGFIVGGIGRKRVVIRALGPSMIQSGVSGTLPDPVLELYGSQGFLISNDNWRDGDAAQLESFGLAPGADLEAGVAVTLDPGSYTAIVRGNGGTTGVALVEVYDCGALGTQ